MQLSVTWVDKRWQGTESFQFNRSACRHYETIYDSGDSLNLLLTPFEYCG